MLAALQSWALGTALAFGPAAEQPLDVTLVAPVERADRIAQLLAPRLTGAGFHAEFRRCEDFGCAHDPKPGDGPAVIVVVSVDTTDTLVIVTRDTRDGMIVVMDEIPVARPDTSLDGEVLGFAVIRDLTEPPLDRRTEWSVAEREGLDRAPRPEPVEPEAAAAPGTTRPQAFLQVGFGGALAVPLFYERRETLGGLAFAVEAGAAWNPLRRLRLGVGGGVAQTFYGSGLAQSNTDVLAKLRLGVGTSKVWGYGIVGAGLSIVSRDYGDYEDLDVAPSAVMGLGVRGAVSRRVSLGFDVETTIVGLPPIGYITRVSGLLLVAIRLGR